MSTTLVLRLPDFSKPLVIECDSSGTGIGGVLMQDDGPIAFCSKALSTRHLALSTYEKEMLAMVYMVQKWRHYLLGQHFTIRTDHQSLKYLLEQRIGTATQQKWLSKLMGYDYEIVYRSGKENVAADGLSQVHEGGSEVLQLAALSIPYSTLMIDIAKEIRCLPFDLKRRVIYRVCLAGIPCDRLSLGSEERVVLEIELTPLFWQVAIGTVVPVVVLKPRLEFLTEQQFVDVCTLQQSSHQAEDALSQGMQKLQETLAVTLVADPSISGGYSLQMATAMGKLEALVSFVNQADHLRKQTLYQMSRILTVHQAARALLALGDYFQRLRALSELWAARPREPA
ncbi:hypothetical protein HHK36_009415 [Tetracentron sinense]|uniref:DOG1 domain-containing protein n=1 Tax=Tetracentron sinense TaxID=13715 RepID=A0A834ZAV0_TETSI|nr:hypothetical protein HHK36_009415 [Tetracentron sinense]